jgi:hypothetical protein
MQTLQELSYSGILTQARGGSCEKNRDYRAIGSSDHRVIGPSERQKLQFGKAKSFNTEEKRKRGDRRSW